MSAPEGVSLDLTVPPDLEAGVYANGLVVWHTPYEFTLDYFVMQSPPEAARGEDDLPCLGVARVRIPPTLIFDVLKAMNDEMTVYERVYGEIRRPRSGPGAG